MFLTFHETLEDRVRQFRPPTGRPVHLYVCGPTVYDRSHVGHARTYLYFDLVRRFLVSEGRTVRHVMNITDFEDKISARAAALKTTWRALARREERRFFDDIARLGILPPTEAPRASDYVPQMIAAIRRLDRAKLVDRKDGALVYAPPPNVCNRNFSEGHGFDAHLVPEPGAPLPVDDGVASRFLLWRPQEAPAPRWPSPWGPGVPGWHLECYAMAHRLLGLPVDLHGGGTDLIFPHHFTENELAMSLDGVLFSRSFLHLPFVTQNGRKMAKSTGNLVPIATALDAGGPDALRWYLLGTPVTERLEWTSAGFDDAIDRFRRVHRTLRAAVPDGAGGSLPVAGLQALRQRVHKDVADRLGADRAIRRVESYALRVAARADGRYPRGSRTVVRAELQAIDALLGTHLAPGGARATKRRARRAS
jgi:cysteinyl-tRNA synthetase